MKVKSITNKEKRKLRVRRKIKGTGKRPRLSVFRSNRFIYAQLIDDSISRTLFAVSSKNLTKEDKIKISKLEEARKIGQKLAEGAINKKISKAIFDRNGYKYHGRVKALAEGARKAGLKL